MSGWWMFGPTRDVINAWTVKGRSPRHHDAAVARLRAEWPVLADALDALAAADRDGPPPCPAVFPPPGLGEIDVRGFEAEPIACHGRMLHAPPHFHFHKHGGRFEWGLVDHPWEGGVRFTGD